MEEKKVYVITEDAGPFIGNLVVGIADNLETAKEITTKQAKEYCEGRVRWNLKCYQAIDVEKRFYYVTEYSYNRCDFGYKVWWISSNTVLEEVVERVKEEVKKEDSYWQDLAYKLKKIFNEKIF